MAEVVAHSLCLPVTVTISGAMWRATGSRFRLGVGDSHSTAFGPDCLRTGNASDGPVSSEPRSSLSTPVYLPHGSIMCPDGDNSHW